MRTSRSDFRSEGTRCSGTLWLPEDGVEKPPVVVMAHGFGAESSFGLPPFAERLTAGGIAVFMFDYRGFDGSDGEPRNLVSPRGHLRDWRAAVAHARRLPEVDGGRVGLWGTSFSGGHVLVTAAGDPGIKAVVSQVPFVDGVTTVLNFPPAFVAKGLFHALLDLGSLALRRRPHKIKIIGRPEEFALMNTPECYPGYMALVPEGTDCKNECPARIGVTLFFYRPVSHVARIRCPVLVVAAENDSLIPYRTVLGAAEKIERARVVSLPAGHFDVYAGGCFERVARLESEFLREFL